jgi:hypothetical protein
MSSEKYHQSSPIGWCVKMCLEVTCVVPPRPVNMEMKRDSGPQQSKLCLRMRVYIIVVIRPCYFNYMFFFSYEVCRI